MAWVQPNTEVRLLTGVPLNQDYIHTLYWDDNGETTQTMYFLGKTHKIFNPQTYQRNGTGVIRVREKFENLVHCNYMMYKNSSHQNKWYYAFVENVEYVNENTTEVSFTIDVMQTWYFDYKLIPCFVDREHYDNDTIGASTIDEAIEMGEYIVYDSVPLVPPHEAGTDGHFIIGIEYNTTNNQMLVWQQGNECEMQDIPSGESYYSMTNLVPRATQGTGIPFVANNQTSRENALLKLQNAIKLLDTETANIVCIYVVPSEIANMDATGDNGKDVIEYVGWTRLPYKEVSQPLYFPYRYRSTTYTPKNKKLYQHPYQLATVSDNAGNNKDYLWENFYNFNVPDMKARFLFRYNGAIDPTLELIPYHYNGVETYYNESTFITGFPSVLWSEDSYARWWAVNKTTWSTSMAMRVLDRIVASLQMSMGLTAYAGGRAMGALSTESTGFGTLRGTLRGKDGYIYSKQGYGIAGPDDQLKAGRSLLSSVGSDLAGLGKSSFVHGQTKSYEAMQSIVSLIAQKADAKRMEDSLHGGTGDNPFVLPQGLMFPTLFEYTISGEFAERIDHYLSTYGYACHEIKVPNIQDGQGHWQMVRDNWYYVKTVGCHVTGTLPTDVEMAIQDIYDSGITFWRDPSKVGDYEYYEWDNEVTTP